MGQQKLFILKITFKFYNYNELFKLKIIENYIIGWIKNEFREIIKRLPYR